MSLLPVKPPYASTGSTWPLSHGPVGTGPWEMSTNPNTLGTAVAVIGSLVSDPEVLYLLPANMRLCRLTHKLVRRVQSHALHSCWYSSLLGRRKGSHSPFCHWSVRLSFVAIALCLPLEEQASGGVTASLLVLTQRRVIDNWATEATPQSQVTEGTPFGKAPLLVC